MKVSGIYKIINTVNGKYYVGSSINIDGSRGRWYNHKYQLRRNKHYNPHLQHAWNKYGENAFRFLVVEVVEGTNLQTVEQKYLDVAKTEQSSTYNMDFDAFKSTMNDATRLKISLALKGKAKSPEARRNMSLVRIGKKLSPEHIQNIVKAKTGTKWGHHSKETKRKMSVAQSGSKNAGYDFTVHKWINVQTGQEFHGTQYDFSNAFNLDKGGVNLVLKGRRNSLYGWKVLCE